MGEEEVARCGELAAAGELWLHREGSEGRVELEEKITGMWPSQNWRKPYPGF